MFRMHPLLIRATAALVTAGFIAATQMGAIAAVADTAPVVPPGVLSDAQVLTDVPVQITDQLTHRSLDLQILKDVAGQDCTQRLCKEDLARDRIKEGARLSYSSLNQADSIWDLRVVDLKHGLFLIQPAGSGLCAVPSGDKFTTDPRTLYLTPCTNDSNMRWYVEPTGTAMFIRHADSGQCLSHASNFETSPTTRNMYEERTVRLADCRQDGLGQAFDIHHPGYANVAVSDSRVFASDAISGHSKVSTLDGSAISTIDSQFSSFRGIAVSPSGDTAYFTDPANNRIAVVNVAGKYVERFIAVGARPLAVAVTPDGARLVVASDVQQQTVVITLKAAGHPDDQVDRVDYSQHPVQSDVDATTKPDVGPIAGWDAVAISADSQTAYLVTHESENVGVLNVPTHQLTGVVSVSGMPTSVAIAKDGTVVVPSGTLPVVNLITGDTVTKAPSKEIRYTSVAAAPGGTVFLADSVSGTVSELTLGKNAAFTSRSAFLPQRPQSLAIADDGKTLFLSLADDGNIARISVENDALTVAAPITLEPVTIGRFLVLATLYALSHCSDTGDFSGCHLVSKSKTSTVGAPICLAKKWNNGQNDAGSGSVSQMLSQTRSVMTGDVYTSLKQHGWSITVDLEGIPPSPTSKLLPKPKVFGGLNFVWQEALQKSFTTIDSTSATQTRTDQEGSTKPGEFAWVYTVRSVVTYRENTMQFSNGVQEPWTYDIPDFALDVISDPPLIVMGTAYSPMDHGACFSEGEVESLTAPVTVRFDANGGTGAPPVPAVFRSAYVPDPGAVMPDAPTAMTKSGLEFDGWNTKADGSGQQLAVGAHYRPNSDSTVYAQWKLPSATASASSTPPSSTPASGTSGATGAAGGGTQASTSPLDVEEAPPSGPMPPTAPGAGANPPPATSSSIPSAVSSGGH